MHYHEKASFLLASGRVAGYDEMCTTPGVPSMLTVLGLPIKTFGAGAGGAGVGNTPPHLTNTPRPDPSSSGAAAGMTQQGSAQGKGRGQNPRAARTRGQGSANSPAANPPMQILQPPPRSEYSATFTCAAILIAKLACPTFQWHQFAAVMLCFPKSTLSCWALETIAYQLWIITDIHRTFTRLSMCFNLIGPHDVKLLHLATGFVGDSSACAGCKG